MRTIALVALLTACTHPAATPATPATPAAAPRVAERFDDKVRQDFFDGMRGDTAALDRAIRVCEDTLARDPKHAEALVWHGAGLLARSSVFFRAGDSEHGLPLYEQGLAQMDEAVALAPAKVGVRIPRGAVLLAMAPHVPGPEKDRLLALGVGDYEATLTTQDAYFATLPLHAREQLLYGLTDGYANLGRLDKARATYTRMTRDAADSELLPRAKARAAGDVVDGPTPCEQCHAR